jgi:hypothetical protein
MKRALIFGLGTALLLGALACWYVYSPALLPGRVDAGKIVASAQAYAQTLKSQGAAVPPTISLQVLIQSGLLPHKDVSGFDGLSVMVSLQPLDPAQPRQFLAEASLADGSRLVVYSDGTVQQFAK